MSTKPPTQTAARRHADNLWLSPGVRLLYQLVLHGAMSREQREDFMNIAIMIDYFGRDDHRGGLMMPGRTFVRRGGKVHTFKDVKLKLLLKHAEDWIKNHVDEEDRTSVFENVMRGIPGAKRTPDWDQPKSPPRNPNARPDTEFSASRAVCSHILSPGRSSDANKLIAQA